MSLHSSDNLPSSPSASRLRSSSLSEPQSPACPQSQEINAAAIWPTEVPQSPTWTHTVAPSNSDVPYHSTEPTAQRMSFSATSLNRFSLQRIKSNGKSLEQPPPLPPSAPPKTPKKKKTLGPKSATGSLKGVHRRASSVEKKASASINPTSNIPSCTPPRTPTRLTNANPASPIQAQSQAQILNDAHAPLAQDFAPSHVLKQKRSFFQRMADRLTRSRTSLRDEYKDKENSSNSGNHPHVTRQREPDVIDEVTRAPPRSRQITPSPSSASLRPSNHLPAPHFSALPSPSLRSRPPSPHPPPTHALPPTPISNTVSYTWDHISLGAPPADYDALPPTPISTRSRKSRPPAIKVPGIGAEQGAVLVVGDEEDDLRPPTRHSTPCQPVTRDVKSISPSSVLQNPSPRLPPSPDTRAPLPMSFPLPPMSPPGYVPSPRANVFTSRSFTSPPTSFSTPPDSTVTTLRKSSSIDAALPPPGKSYIPPSKTEARGRDAVEKVLDIASGPPDPVVASWEELVASEKEGLFKIRDRAATLGERELKREGGRSRANSHARADSHTLAGFDLEMQMKAASVQAAVSSTTSSMIAQALAQEQAENDLPALSKEQEQRYRGDDSSTIPLPVVNSIYNAITPALNPGSSSTSPSSPNRIALEGRSPIRSQFDPAGLVDGSSGGFTLPKSSLSPRNIITTTDSSSVVHAEPDMSSSGEESCNRVSRWLAASPTEMSAESTIDRASLDVWREELNREDDEDDDDNMMPEVERMALETEESVRQMQEKEQGMVGNNGEKPKKKRSLFGRREKRDTSSRTSLRFLPRVSTSFPAHTHQLAPKSPTPFTSTTLALSQGSQRMHTQDSMLLQAKDIADPESRRISEMVFLH